MTISPKPGAHESKPITVRIAAVEQLLRSIHDWNGFENQVRCVMQAAGDYKPQFVLLPEIFTTPPPSDSGGLKLAHPRGRKDN